MSDRKLEAYLDHKHELWFCRGEGKCTAKKPRAFHCDDCLHGDDEETLAAIEEKLRKGDA